MLSSSLRQPHIFSHLLSSHKATEGASAQHCLQENKSACSCELLLRFRCSFKYFWRHRSINLCMQLAWTEHILLAILFTSPFLPIISCGKWDCHVLLYSAWSLKYPGHWIWWPHRSFPIPYSWSLWGRQCVLPCAYEVLETVGIIQMQVITITI